MGMGSFGMPMPAPRVP
jgi:RNA recognition motif-containing protein